MNKRIIAVITALVFVLTLTTVAWAEIPTGPNSGPSVIGPHTHVDNSGMTVTPPAPRPNKITIIVGDKEVNSDVPPYETEGRVMVPYRFVAEALGCMVGWDGETNKVTATQYGNTVWMIIGQKEININGDVKNVDVAPELKDDRTFVPVRFISEALGYKVSWNDNTRKVLIYRDPHAFIQQ